METFFFFSKFSVSAFFLFNRFWTHERTTCFPRRVDGPTLYGAGSKIYAQSFERTNEQVDAHGDGGRDD